MLLRRFTQHIKKQDWFAVGLDIIVVIVGIFLGMQVSEWNDVRKDRIKEQQYLQELRSDFLVNQEEIIRTDKGLQLIVEDIQFLINFSLQPTKSFDESKLLDGIRSLQSLRIFYDTRRTYDLLINSGDIKVISSSSLNDALAAFYAQQKSLELVMNTHELQHVNLFLPYFIDSFENLGVHRNFTRLKEKLPNTKLEVAELMPLIRSTKFRNIAVQKWIICQDVRNQLLHSKKRNEDILRIIDGLLATDSGAQI